jgi:hypothetical protein
MRARRKPLSNDPHHVPRTRTRPCDDILAFTLSPARCDGCYSAKLDCSQTCSLRSFFTMSI